MKEKHSPKWALSKPLDRMGWTINDHDLTAGYTVTKYGNVRIFSKHNGKRRESIIQPMVFFEIVGAVS